MKRKRGNCCDSKHPDHRDQKPRLRRVAGQVEGIMRMIDERRYCPEILIQLRAARAALNAIEAKLLESHLKACVADAFTSASTKEKLTKIDELTELFRRL